MTLEGYVKIKVSKLGESMQDKQEFYDKRFDNFILQEPNFKKFDNNPFMDKLWQ